MPWLKLISQQFYLVYCCHCVLHPIPAAKRRSIFQLQRRPPSTQMPCHPATHSPPPSAALSSAALLRAAAATSRPLSRPPQVGAADLSPGHVQPRTAIPARLCPVRLSSVSLLRLPITAPSPARPCLPPHGCAARTLPPIRGSFSCQVADSRSYATALRAFLPRAAAVASHHGAIPATAMPSPVRPSRAPSLRSAACCCVG